MPVVLAVMTAALDVLLAAMVEVLPAALLAVTLPPVSVVALLPVLETALRSGRRTDPARPRRWTQAHFLPQGQVRRLTAWLAF